MSQRSSQILLIASILWLSWLAMMLMHECGHVLGAFCTGGEVRRVVWHAAVISRTDVRPNPHPLVEVWAGPVIGILIPLAGALFATGVRLRFAYLMWIVAGFCLIANGAYFGVGAIHPLGDTRELVAHGMPRWPMAAFGVVAVVAGMWIWHRVSPQMGFGIAPEPINSRHAYGAFVLAVLATAIGFAFGDRGI